MKDLNAITSAVEQLIKDNLDGYTVERNPRRNTSPDRAASGKGWIGIYVDRDEYVPWATGPQWQALVDVVIEYQYAHSNTLECEKQIQAGKNELLTLILGTRENRTLLNTVDIIVGIPIDYEKNEDYETNYQAALIKIQTESRV